MRRANRRFAANRTLLFATAIALAAACGKSARKNAGGGSRSDAGESGAGRAGDPGSGGRGGAAGASTGGSEGGESSGGAMSGAGRGGAAGQAGSRAIGGASAAGASTAGAGGIATPDGCMYTSHLVGGLFCSLEMTCGAERVLVSCDVDSDTWRCGCVRGNERTGFYFFPDVTGVRTCEASATACVHPELLDGDEVCTLTDAPSGASCSATDTCVRTHEIDGVTLETRSEWTASCELCTGSAHACCSCDEGRFPDYRLSSSDITGGCLYLDELCRGDNEVTPDGGSCERFDESLNEVACGVGARCEYPIALADGTRLTFADTFRTLCSAYDVDTVGRYTQCRCTDEDGWETLNVRFDQPAPDRAMCLAASDACTGLVFMELLGAPDCTEYTVSTSPSESSCRRQKTCSQLANLFGTEVRTFSGNLVDCLEQADGRWSCSCFYGLKNEELVHTELDADDSESACAQAVAECPLVPTTIY